MYYTDLLRVRNGLFVYAIVIAGVFALSVLTLALNGMLGQWHMQAASDRHLDLDALFAMATFSAMFFTFAMGTGLSCENSGHLPVKWTKPVSRVRAALTTFAFDAAGIIAAVALTFVTIVAIIALVGGASFIRATPDSAEQLARFIVYLLAFYGLIAAAGASLGGRGRAVSWAILGGSLLIGGFDASALPKPWGTIFTLLDYLNPMRYGSYHDSPSKSETIQFGMTSTNLALGVDIAALCLLAAAGLIAALLQWRRLEA